MFRRRVQAYIQHYNHVRLHSAIGYITPADKLVGLEEVIGAERDCQMRHAIGANSSLKMHQAARMLLQSHSRGG